MYQTCGRAYAAPDEGKKRLGWNTFLPDQREDDRPQSLDQLDPAELSWFKAKSTLVYQFPSVVLVEEVVLRDDLANVNSDEPKTATGISQKQEHPLLKGKTVKKLTSQTYPKGSHAPQKTMNTSKKQPTYKGKLPYQGKQGKGTDESTKQRSTVKWGGNHGQHRNGASNFKGKYKPAIKTDPSLDRGANHKTKNKGGKGKGAQLLSVLKGSSGDTKKALECSTTSTDSRARQTSSAKPRGVLRRLELDAESFFEFLFSDRWQEGCLVRVLTGRLLESILHCLTRLEKFHDVISYTTIAYFYNKRPLLPCMKTVQDKKEYELVEERVLVEFDCFYPQARPEAIVELLEITGSPCFPTDEQDRTSEQPSISTSKDLGQDIIFQTASILSGSDGKEHQEDFPHKDISKKNMRPYIKLKSFSNSSLTASEIPRPEGRAGRYRRAFSCPEAELPPSDKVTNWAEAKPDTSDSRPSGEDLPHNTSDSRPSDAGIPHNTSDSRPSDAGIPHNTSDSRPSDAGIPRNRSGSRPSDAGIPRNRSGSRPSDAGIPHNTSDSRPSDAGIPRNRSGSRPSDAGIPRNRSGSRPSDAGIPRNRAGSRPSDAGIPRNRSDSRPSDAGIPRNRSGSRPSDAGIPRNRSGSRPSDAGIPRNRSGSRPSDAGIPRNRAGSRPSDAGIPRNRSDSRPSDAGIPRNRSGSRPSDAGIPRNRAGSRPSDAGIPRNRSDSRPSNAGILRNRSGSREGKNHGQSNMASNAEKPSATDTCPQQSPDQPTTNPSNGKLLPIADLVSYSSHDTEQTPRSSIPSLPPIADALPPTHSRNSSWAMTVAFEAPDSAILEGMGQQVSPTNVDTIFYEKTASYHTSLAHQYTLSEDRMGAFSDDQMEYPRSEGRSCCGVELPPLKCNIRGLTRPLPPHSSCLRAFHMIRQPFWERRCQQRGAFPRIGLPELPVTIDRDLEAEQERDLQDQNYLGLILQDETELVASTISLPMYPPDEPLTGKELVPRSGKSTKEHAVGKKNKSKTDMSASITSTDSSSIDTEEDVLCFHPDPVRKKNLLNDIEMMRQEFFVNPSLPKEAKDDSHKRQQQGVKSTVQSLQPRQGQESKQKGARKETLSNKNMLFPHTFSSQSATPVSEPDLLTVPLLSYQEAPTPVPPCNLLKKWDKTPNFYEFCLYLLQKRTTEKGRRGDKRLRPDKKIAEESRHSLQQERTIRHSRAEQSKKKASKQSFRLQESESNLSDDEEPQKHRQSKQEALQALHAHTRIQIAAEERRFKSAAVCKKSSSQKPYTASAGAMQSVESMLKQASLGVTATGVHLLTEEQEKVLEDEGNIMSSMDPWHLSVGFAYLAGGVCDSVGVRNDLLKRRERIMNLFESSKQTVKLNETLVKHTVKSAQDKTIGKASKEGEEVSQDNLRGVPEKLHSVRKKSAKEIAKIKEMEENFDTEEGEEQKKPRVKPKSSIHAAAAHQTDTEERREEGHPSQKDRQKDAEDDKGTHIDRAEGKQKPKKRKEKKPEQKHRPYVYIDDSKINDTISPDKLFRLMGLNDQFDSQKLHSAYSFEKFFNPRKSKTPNYSTLLSVFEKPFKQKKKKEAQTKTETNKEEVAVEIETEESPVEESPPDVPFVLGKLRDFKFLQHRNHQPEPLKMEDKASKKMSADELCQNMILAMQIFVVRKERATTTYGSCQYKSKVSVTFTKRREGDALLGVPPLVDCQHVVKAVCQTLSQAL